MMGFGVDEDLGFLADEFLKNDRIEAGNLTDREKMLNWLDVDEQEFSQMSASDRENSLFQWQKFGRKEYKKMYKVNDDG